MSLSTRKNPFARAVVAGVAALSLSAMAGCSETTGDEEDVSVADVQDEDAAGGEETPTDEADVAPEDLAYEGIYDDAFVNEIDSYEGETVTVSAEIEEIISDQSFTIAGDDVEALLVVGADGTSDLSVDSSVEVTGTVHASFDLPTVEEEVGADLDDAAFEEWDQEPYLMAENIDATLDEAEEEDTQ